MEQNASYWEIPQPEISEEARKIKELRKQGNILGGALLIYKGVMNVAVYSVMTAAGVIYGLVSALAGGWNSAADPELDYSFMQQLMNDASGWGYILAILICMVVLLLWKKPQYISMTILQRGKSMTAGSFFMLVCLAFGCQLPAQLLAYGFEWLSNLLGGSFLEVLQENAVQTNSLHMWLYVCFGAPIAEEFLFRGLMLRTLEPYGKRFAIVVTAVLFGLFHGSPVQTPFAMLIGLILGYVAIEYDVIWSIVLHIMNNLLLSDLLPRLLAVLPLDLAGILFWVILAGFFLAALFILLEKAKYLSQISWDAKPEPWQRKTFWRSPCIIILTVWCLLELSMYFLYIFL